MKRPCIAFSTAISVALVFAATDSAAQLNDHNFRGDYGLTSGSQPPPGWWVSMFFAQYETDTVRNQAGERTACGPMKYLLVRLGTSIHPRAGISR